jgi:hypothetical protein
VRDSVTASFELSTGSLLVPMLVPLPLLRARDLLLRLHSCSTPCAVGVRIAPGRSALPRLVSTEPRIAQGPLVARSMYDFVVTERCQGCGGQVRESRVRMVARGRVSYTTSTRFRIAKKGGGGVRVGGVSARNRRSATFYDDY